MKPKFIVNDYMMTCFVKFFIDENPAQLLDILFRFADNPYYDSKTPIARHGILDFFANREKKYDYEYNCKICDDLLAFDRYSIQGRVAFFELMRIYLPSYSIILRNNKEIEVQAFLSIYSDGYCGITHVYSGMRVPLSKNICEFLESENCVKYIKLDRFLVEILNITSENLTGEYNGIKISKEDFMEIAEGNPFNIHIEIIAKILSTNIDFENPQSSETNEPQISYNGYKDIFRVYNILSNGIVSDVEIKKIRILIEGLDNLHDFNDNIYTELLNLSIDYNELILLSYKYLLFIKQPEYKANNRRFIPMYAMIEYFLNERCKLFEAQHQLRNLNYYSDLTQEQLIDFRSRYLDIIKMDVGYEFYRPEEAQSVGHIKQVLRINFLYEEIQRTFVNFFHAKKLDWEIEERDRQSREQSKENKFNKMIQIFTLMLTIPAVTQIVDIFYTIEVKKIIVFPIGLSKLIWVSLTSIIIFVFYRSIDRK